MFYEEESKDLKEGIRGTVLLFRAIWDEVNHEFSELNRDERFRIFSTIAPLLTDALIAMADTDLREDFEREGRKSS